MMYPHPLCTCIGQIIATAAMVAFTVGEVWGVGCGWSGGEGGVTTPIEGAAGVREVPAIVCDCSVCSMPSHGGVLCEGFVMTYMFEEPPKKVLLCISRLGPQ